MRELGVVCHACFCTFYTSEMNTHSYMPFLFSIIFFVPLVELAWAGAWPGLVIELAWAGAWPGLVIELAWAGAWPGLVIELGPGHGQG